MTVATLLPTPPAERTAAVAWVERHLGHLAAGPVTASSRFDGTAEAAHAALDAFDVAGYAGRRNAVDPPHRRGASGLSPWVRHGLLTLRHLWDHVEGGPARDVAKLRDELLWQEYARHWYARLGGRTRAAVHAEPPQRRPAPGGPDEVFDRSMRCLGEVLGELDRDGWLVNQTRMWVASHWAVRQGRPWQDGEAWLFTQLLDGSRAANRLGWQWTTGAGSAKPYGFSRWQVEKRAPGWCASCPLRDACPIEDWPASGGATPVPRDPLLTSDLDLATTAGPRTPVRRATPDVVLLTAESLGPRDPALAAHPDLPVLFTFDGPLLARLRLDGRRLVFLAQALGGLAAQREVEVHLGRPADVLVDRRVAVTHAPVPGFRRLAGTVPLAERHPWPWLAPPHARSIASFSAWRRHAAVPTSATHHGGADDAS